MAGLPASSDLSAYNAEGGISQGLRTRRTCTMTTVSCRQPQRATSDLSSGGAENTLSLNMTARPGMRVIGCPVCASYGGALMTMFLIQAGCKHRVL